MYGPNGAAYVFGPQKGADEETVRFLDRGLVHLCEVMRRDLGIDLGETPGGGAAGGMGAGMPAFFGSELKMGIDAVLDTVDFEKLADGADMIITGEGKIDRQSLRGKVVIGVSRRAKPLNIPVVAVVGDIGDDVDDAYSEGVSGIFSINRVAVDFKAARLRARDDLARTIYNLMRFLRATGRYSR
jgi:glycerate kinase